jgi:hypothetical protein
MYIEENILDMQDQDILKLLIKKNDIKLTEKTVNYLFSIKNTHAIKLILKNITQPFNEIDYMSNCISSIGDTELFDLFYKNNISEINKVHDITRTNHGNYKNSFNFYSNAIYFSNIDFIKHLLGNTNLSPTCYSNEILYQVLEHSMIEILDLLIKDKRAILAINQNKIKNLKISEEMKVCISTLSNKIKIDNF